MSETEDDKDKAEKLGLALYQDAAQPAVRLLGETTRRVVSLALAPVRGLVFVSERIEAFVESRVAEKLKDVSPENIQEPSARIATPLLLAAAAADGETELQELFAGLLASAMDKSKATKAHPAFVRIIQDMTADEARLVTYIWQSWSKSAGSHPVIWINAAAPNSIGYYPGPMLTGLAAEANCQFIDMEITYLDNLKRLGLIVISDDKFLTNDAEYEALENSHEALSWKESWSKRGALQIKKGTLELTGMSHVFFSACKVPILRTKTDEPVTDGPAPDAGVKA